MEEEKQDMMLNGEEAPQEESELLGLAGKLVELIQDNTREGRLTGAGSLLEPLHEWDQEQLDQLLACIRQEEAYQDIQTISGKETDYYYSSQWMTAVYAGILVNVVEQDLFQLIAETVRKESQIYPRPTHTQLFSLAPYKLPKETIGEVVGQLMKEAAYADIQMVKASNGAMYLFSDRFMKKAHAASLAQWLEVDRYENP